MMKNAIKLLLLAVSLAALSGTAMAQDDRQRPTREQLAEVQARHIAEEDDGTPLGTPRQTAGQIRD